MWCFSYPTFFSTAPAPGHKMTGLQNLPNNVLVVYSGDELNFSSDFPIKLCASRV